MADGNIGFAGRNDDQVKLRGFRIEPGEIAGVLKQHPDIEEAIALAVSRTLNEKELAAYLATSKAPPSLQELASFLPQSLPDPMVPAPFVAFAPLHGGP